MHRKACRPCSDLRTGGLPLSAMLLRDFRLFKRGVIPALVLTLILALACTLAAYGALRAAGGETRLLRVCYVDDEDSMFSRSAIRMLRSVPGVSDYASLEKISGEEVEAAIAGGEYAGAMALPAGILDDLVAGRPTEIRLLISDSASWAGDFIRMGAGSAQILLNTFQVMDITGMVLLERAGVPEQERYVRIGEFDSEMLARLAELTAVYAEDIVLPYGGTGLSAQAWYALQWTTLLLLFAGLFFNALYTEDCGRSILARLYASGIRPEGFLAGKLLYPLLFRGVILLGILLPLGRFMPLIVNVRTMLPAVLSLVFLTVLTSCAAVLLQKNGGYLHLLLAVGAAGLVLTGGIVPRTMLPKAMTVLGDMTPLGAAAGLLSPLFGGPVRAASFAMAAVYGCLAAFFALRALRRLPEERGIT